VRTLSKDMGCGDCGALVPLVPRLGLAATLPSLLLSSPLSATGPRYLKTNNGTGVVSWHAALQIPHLRFSSFSACLPRALVSVNLLPVFLVALGFARALLDVR
jgi:hypothetical protein